jgi:hypothetical protein
MLMRRTVCCLLLCLSSAASARAQQQPKEPIGRFAVDLRGSFARHKAEPSVATDLGVDAGTLPPRTFGLVGGAHIYALHTRKITLGLGGNAVFGRGSRTLDVLDSTGKPVVPAQKTPTVRRHFTSFSPEISLNFGHRNGWSYISGGMLGRSKLYLDRADQPAAGAPYRKTINYGGGARWFTSDRLAFSVDFRWYSVAEQPATASLIAQPRTTLLVLSGGIAIK